MNSIESDQITGLALAGGRGERMGGRDKGLVCFGGKPLVSYALGALRQVAGTVMISANRNLDAYRQFACPVITDSSEGFDGPLAGVLAGMGAARTEYLLTVPCDCPFMTGELLDRLVTALVREEGELSVAFDGQRLHPVFLLARRNLSADLADYLATGQRKMETWLRRHHLVLTDFRDVKDRLANLNSPADLDRFQESEGSNSGN